MYNEPFNNQNGFSQNIFGEDVNVDVDVMMNSNSNVVGGPVFQGGSVSQPIVEPMQERVVNRTIMHEVPHICPIHTKIINNHVYRHTYSPRYTCCEENVCTNVQCGSCCCFNNR